MIGAGSAAFAAMMLAVIYADEGLELVAYRDIGGVVTICGGDTQNVRMGQKATRAECDARTMRRLIEHEDGMLRCIRRRMPAKVHEAMLRLTYNVGPDAFCRSSIPRKINAGDLAAACEAILSFNKICRGTGEARTCREVRGLTNRRIRENATCKEGLGQHV